MKDFDPTSTPAKTLEDRFSALADQFNDLSRDARTSTPTITPVQAGMIFESVVDVLESFGLTLRKIEDSIEKQRTGPTLDLLDDALVHIGVGNGALEATQHLLNLARRALYEADDAKPTNRAEQNTA